MPYDVDNLHHLINKICSSLVGEFRGAKKGISDIPNVDSAFEKFAGQLLVEPIPIAPALWDSFMSSLGRQARLTTKDISSIRQITCRVKHIVKENDGKEERDVYKDVVVTLVKSKNGIQPNSLKTSPTPSNFQVKPSESLNEKDIQVIKTVAFLARRAPLLIIAGAAIDIHIPTGGMLSFFASCDLKKKLLVVLLCIWGMIREWQIIKEGAETVESQTNAMKIFQLYQQSVFKEGVHVLTSNWSNTLEMAGFKEIKNTKKNTLVQTSGKPKDEWCLTLGEKNDLGELPNISKHILIILGSTLRPQDFWLQFAGYVEHAAFRLVINNQDINYKEIFAHITQEEPKQISITYWKILCDVSDFLHAFVKIKLR